MTSQIFVLLLQLLAVAKITYITNATPENNYVTMLTSNEGVYKTMVSWKIENFLEMPYVKMRLNEHGVSFFKSELFPDQSVNGVKWQFHLERNGSETLTRDNDTSINLMLVLKAQQNISSFAGSCQCGILNDKGTGFNAIPLVKQEVLPDYSFIFRPFVSLNQLKTSNDLLPNGHLTVRCIIEGHLKLNLALRNDVIPSPITKSIDVALCGSEIGQANIKILSTFQVYQIIAIYYKNRFFHITKDIFDQRVLQPPLMTQSNTETWYWQPSAEDFPTETEMIDFLAFVLKGEADNLEKTCPMLYKVAEKFKFECLKYTCLKIISSKQN